MLFRSGNMVYSSGQIPLNKDGVVIEGGIKEQTMQVFENLKAVLAEAGTGLENVIKTTVFLKDMNDFVVMNEVYAIEFDGSVFPARSTVEVAKLPKAVLVEIEVIAEIV